MKLLITNGTIYDAVHAEPYRADLLIVDGKIKEISSKITDAADETFNAEGLSIFPGFIDAHSHLGMDGYGIGFEGSDINEMGDVLSPHLRAIDGFNPNQPTLRHAALAGVTTVCVGPGSANVLGGTFMAIKTDGIRVDDMMLKDNIAMKCAFGENPKRCYREKGNCTRMSTAAKLRETLFKAFEYEKKIKDAGDDASKRPSFDMKLEAMRPVVRREMPLKAHAHQADDLFTAIRIAKEFNLLLTLEHVTEGHLIADALAGEGYPCAVGPSLTHATKFELRNKTWKTPAVLQKAGCKVSIITDAPVIPQEYLPLCAGLAVKNGMDSFEALKAITINPAQHAGIDSNVGSLEAGKDADLVIANGHPFDLATQVVRVYINGKPVQREENENL